MKKDYERIVRQTLVPEYERGARHNRPDWDAFVEDARDDPAGIAYEMVELAETDLDWNVTPDVVDAIFDVAQDWVARLTTTKEE